jgi:tetratricopeptide (TPR) repeat protein
MHTRLVASLLLVLSGTLAGCRLLGVGGTVSQSVATSRQLWQQGLAAIERGQWDRAEPLLLQAVRACPTNADARRSYAEALWNRGARQEAVAQLAEALRNNPEDAGLLVRMAEMRLELGTVDTALEVANQAIDLDPKLAGAWAVRGRAMRAKKRPLEALANSHRALGLAPSDRQIPVEIAEVYGELGQPQRALATLQGVADSYAPGEEPQRVLYLQGLAQTALGRYGDAVEYLTAASTRAQATPEILFRLAEAELAAGQPTQAAASAREALALDPKHQPSRDLVERIEIAQQPGGRIQR